MNTINELQALREELIGEIDARFERMIQALRTEREQPDGSVNRNYESEYSLQGGLGTFKGKRPTGVIFADGTRVDVPTWKRLVQAVMLDCNEKKHAELMNLRGKLLGRDRVLLGSEKGNMRSPVQIARALYIETHYDTETLLRIVTTRILTAVGYDYGGIKVAVRND